ncbi:hypothetical protein [Actinoplanes sp. NBRC 103695]|uniref:hypothetical protein n=1 Tax=Actinoplanes sp. NBRC 103695 TaxID=3032202 RepID=UPI0024A5ED20|nr:hypothetical protein [Actinoplanes sp. NBRC 103695]GLZ00554.1 hypothetical protein Acsp02_78060 [Actinoplanes sp. NBRC 103695]
MSIQTKAALFAAGSGTLALVATVTGRGFPFGPHDPGNGASPLRALDPAVGAPLFAAVLLITAVLLLLLHGPARPPGPARAAILAWCWTVVVALVILVPDVRVLTFAGYLPVLIVGAPFGYPPMDYGVVFNWQLACQIGAMAGGLLVAAAVLRWQRKIAGVCESCGRADDFSTSAAADGRPGWTTPEAAARWGRWAVAVAVAVPAFYAVVRLAWAVHIPFGISDEFLAELHNSGMVWAGAGLGGFALAGAVLTLGLTQRWGEVFPRWMIGLAGRRVPIRLATIPAGLVALAVTAASVAFYSNPELYTSDLSLAHVPQMTWPLWGAALGAATLAYHLRRRPACADCGRGRESDRGLVQARRPDAY